LPSGATAAWSTPRRVIRSCAVATSHNFTVASSLPVPRHRPSGKNARLRTLSVCPLKVARNSPVAASHTFTFPSEPPAARSLLAGERAPQVAQEEAPPLPGPPSSGSRPSPDTGSRSLPSQYLSAVANVLPSLEYARALISPPPAWAWTVARGHNVVMSHSL